MEQDQFCNILCMEHFKSHDVQAFKAIIKEEYHHNWIIDNLPVHVARHTHTPTRPPLDSSLIFFFMPPLPRMCVRARACQAASILDSEQYITTTYAGGFPVGYQDGGKAYIFNHVNIIVEYHPLDVSWQTPHILAGRFFALAVNVGALLTHAALLPNPSR
jgi:transmembrane 9 superfamily protein 2/4